MEMFQYLEEFRSSVWRRTTESVQFPTDSELITESKICYFNIHVCIKEEVLCLQEGGGGGGGRQRVDVNVISRPI